MTVTNGWLDAAQKVDLSGSRGNGPFGASGRAFLGWILHVNVSGKGSNGTSIDYFEHNPGEVCPTFQVYKDGSIVQFLPLNWQPWCQIDGNFNYGAVETGGDPDEPLTDAQLDSIAKIARAYNIHMGAELTIADKPGQKGIGTHEMGGVPWGGHACPGTIRAGQRAEIIKRAKALGNGGGITVAGQEWTRDELDNMISEKVVEGLHSALIGSPRTGEFTHAKHPMLFPGDKDLGVLDRLAKLDGHDLGGGAKKPATGDKGGKP